MRKKVIPYLPRKVQLLFSICQLSEVRASDSFFELR